MKTKLTLIALACAVLSAAACGNKKDTLAPRNSEVTGDMLPYIAGFGEEYYCNTAKNMKPSAALTDSLSYLAGIITGADITYQFEGLNMDRFDKALKDFKAVNFADFDAAAKTNFSGEDNVSDKFEIAPGELGTIVPAFMQAKADTTMEVSESLRDSTSYIYGVLTAYRIGDMKLNVKRFHKGLDRFLEVDKNREFETFSRSNFSDSLYTEYAAKYDIAPDKFQEVMGRCNEISENAMLENVRIQGELFQKEVAKMPGIDCKTVEYIALADTVEVTESADLLYRFTKKAEEDGPFVDYGDSLTVHYTGRHIDYEIFDQGEFPVDGMAEEGLVKGFTEALLMLREGDEIEVVIPGDLGYGKNGSRNWWGGGWNIYPDETLVFVVSVSDLRKPE